MKGKEGQMREEGKEKTTEQKQGSNLVGDKLEESLKKIRSKS